MTDPGREIDVDAFMEPPGQLSLQPGLSNATVDDLLAEHERAEAEAVATMKPPAAATAAPAAAEAQLTPSQKALRQLRGLIFASASGDDPHIVTKLLLPPSPGAASGIEDVSCPCKAGTFNRPRGCYGMVFAREVWGMPAQENQR